MACACSYSCSGSSFNSSLPLVNRACIPVGKLPVLPQTSSRLSHSSSPSALSQAQRRAANFASHISSGFNSSSAHSPPSSSSAKFNFASSETQRLRQTRGCVDWAVRASDEDFEIEEMIDFDDEDKEEEDEEDLQDFETDYDVGRLGDPDRYLEGDSFISTRGEAAESIVDYKINEDEFHKLSLHHCDFFVRKVPDVDNDVYDFREMYVTAPDTDIYAIPRADEKLPKRPVRLTASKHEHICVTEIPVDTLRSPMVKDERQVMKIFLMKHFKNRRGDAPNFVLDFDQIYVIDSKTKSISRAKVTLNVPGGVNRDRSTEVLLVHDDGTTFTVIPQSKRKSPDQIVLERQWNKTKKDLDNYLRSFRDYPVSNWF
eukprot:c18747_g1_i1 orf=81-1196(+)